MHRLLRGILMHSDIDRLAQALKSSLPQFVA
jgi:hypothetical protein